MTFNLYTILAGFFFGGIGYAAWRFGRKTNSSRHMILAIALMVYSYFIADPWLTVIIGCSLTGLLFWPKI